MIAGRQFRTSLVYKHPSVASLFVHTCFYGAAALLLSPPHLFRNADLTTSWEAVEGPAQTPALATRLAERQM